MSNQAQLDDLLMRYEEMRARQTPLSVEELCRDCPELVPNLRRKIQELDALNALLDVQTSADENTPAGPRQTLPLPAAAAGTVVTNCRFRILRAHAAGGLGEVLVAYDEKLRREVALKRLHVPHLLSPHRRQRFLREAEITSRLEHPGIVPVHAVGEDADGRPLYAMRLFRKGNLHEALRHFHSEEQRGRPREERRLALRQLLGRFVAVCNTAGYAHGQGVLHRDIKPSNIVLGDYGETLLVDWGLAKVVGSEQEAVGSEDAETASLLPAAHGALLTAEGAVLGTLPYMSPEQVAGGSARLGPAADVYSLGATLYELLTGQAPFPALGAAPVLGRVERGEFPRLRQVNREVPAALEAVCLKALALRPEARYASALDLAADVERWLADEPVTAWREPWTVRALQWSRRHKKAVAVAALFLVVSVVGLAAHNVFLRFERKRTEANFVLARELGYELATLLKNTDHHSEAGQVLLRALELYERQAPEVQGASAGPQVRTLVLLSTVHRLNRQFSRAEETLREVVGLCEKLKAKFPDSAFYRESLAFSHSSLTSLLREMGRATQAEYHVGQALNEYARLVKDFPQETRYTVELTALHLNQGNHWQSIARFREAAQAYQQAQDLLLKLVAHSREPDHKRRLAAAHNALGNLRTATGPPEEAEKEYRKAEELLKELADKDPHKPNYPQALALTLTHLGSLLRARGRYSEAAEALQGAVVINEKLAARFPNEPDFAIQLARSYINRGILLSLWNQLPDHLAKGEEDFCRALKIHEEKLPAEFKNLPRCRRDRAEIFNNLGECLRLQKQGRLAEAEKVSRRAVELYGELVASHSAEFAYRLGLAISLHTLADVLKDAHRLPEAEQTLRQAVETFEELRHVPGIQGERKAAQDALDKLKARNEK